MTEIKDRVIAELRSAGFGEGQINYVLGMREVAIVDREAELPLNPKSIYTGGMSERDVGEFDGFNKAISQVAEAGWVKEEK